MYNNEVTYNEQWNTPENRKALETLQRKFFDKSECSPDCPVAWAPEVLELMETLERELGFYYNESTMRGYYIQGTPKDWFLYDPILSIKSAFESNILSAPADWSKPRGPDGTRPRKSAVKRFLALLTAPLHSVGYGFRALKIKYIHPILNKIRKPKIRLGQLKEKYGELTCYFHTTDAFEEYVDREVRKTEIKLALKGCYYPIEGFWTASIGYTVGTEYRPDTITTKVDPKDGTINVKETTYRGVMKELGLDLKEIEKKYIMKQASKADPQDV